MASFARNVLGWVESVSLIIMGDELGSNGGRAVIIWASDRGR